MPNDETVPPAFRLEFEQLANDVCDRARIDHNEWTLPTSELATHLQERWRDWRETGLSKEAARQRVLELFGSPSDVAKSLKRPWYLRVLVYERYRPHRYFLFLAAYMLLSWVVVLHTLAKLGIAATEDQILPEDGIQSVLTASTAGVLFPILPVEWLVHGMGMFFFGSAAAASVLAIRWRPVIGSRNFQRVLLLRSALSLVALYAIVALATRPWLLLLEETDYGRHMRHLDVLLVGPMIAAGVLGATGALCMISELLDFPELLGRSRGQHEKQAVVREGYVTPQLIYCWVMVFGVLACLLGYYEYTRLDRFSRVIAAANRMEVFDGRFTDGRGITVDGAEVQEVVREITTASRGMATRRNPFHFVYAVEFFNDTNSLGIIHSDREWFWINHKQEGMLPPHLSPQWFLDRHGQYRFRPDSTCASVLRRAHRELETGVLETKP
jgi:hypothetical protein